MSRDIIYNPQLRQKLVIGSEKLCHTVENNFGPVGKNTIMDRKYDLPVVANTGRKILRDFSVEEPSENISAVLVRDAALKVAEECGDGSMATAMLTDCLIRNGGKLIAAGYNPVYLRKGAAKTLQLVHKYLKAVTLPLDEIGIEKLAAAVSKNDEVAANVEKAFNYVGADGVVTVQDSQFRETIINYWDGARFDCGLYGNGFINDAENRRTVLHEPYVFLSNVKIKTLQDIRKLLENVIRNQASLLMIASDISEEVLQLLSANVSKGLKVAAVKAPGYAEERRRNMLSLAAKIGSLMFDENTGVRMEDCGLEVCSKIGLAQADKNSTTLQGFRNTSEEMTEILRKHTLQQLEKTADYDEMEKLQTTLSILNGKTVEIIVGAPIEYEMFEKKYLYENTVRCIRNAARSGLVPGAGNAYLFLENHIRSECETWDESEAAGARCVCDALHSMTKKLLENSCENGEMIIRRIMEAGNPFIGYDVLSGTLTDLKFSGIMTPEDTLEKIIRVSVETSASLWTADAAVLECAE